LGQRRSLDRTKAAPAASASSLADAVDPFEKVVHEMLPRLLAVADDVDPGIFLQFDGEDRCLPLCLG
jgi:hypothetical protein